jgi:hypothetical protein
MKYQMIPKGAPAIGNNKVFKRVILKLADKKITLSITEEFLGDV